MVTKEEGHQELIPSVALKVMFSVIPVLMTLELVVSFKYRRLLSDAYRELSRRQAENEEEDEDTSNG